MDGASIKSASPTMQRYWKIAIAVAIFMVVLAMIGVGLTTTSKQIAQTYWMSLVPVYGILCVAVAWIRKRQGATGRVVIRQVFHWMAIAAAIWLDFYIRGAGQETGQAAGFTALLLLALGCVLAGVHLEWMFAVVGVLLATTLMLAEKADQYLWLIFVVGAIAVAAMLWLMRVVVKAGQKDKAAHATATGS